MLSSTPSTSNPKKSRGRPVAEDDQKSKKSRDSHAGSQKSILNWFTVKPSKYENAVKRRLEQEQEQFNQLTLEDCTSLFCFTTKQTQHEDTVVRPVEEHKEQEVTHADRTGLFDEEEDFDDYHACIGGADSDDDDDSGIQGRQQVEAEKVFYSKMPTVVTLTREMSGGFWNASQTENLLERLLKCAPAPALKREVVRDAAHKNYTRQLAEGIALRVESPLNAMCHQGLGDVFMITSWCTARNVCMKDGTVKPTEEDEDGALEFDSLLNFRRHDNKVATTGAMTLALAIMLTPNGQEAPPSSGLHWADVVTLSRVLTNTNAENSNFYVSPSVSDFRDGIKELFPLVMGNPDYSTIWVQGADATQAILQESRRPGSTCAIQRAPAQMLAAFGLAEPDVSINWPSVKNSGVWMVRSKGVAQFLFSVTSLGSTLAGAAGKHKKQVLWTLKCINNMVGIERAMRHFDALPTSGHTLLGRLSAVAKSTDAAAAARQIGLKDSEYVSPSVAGGLAGGLKMKEKCSTAEGKQAHALSTLGEETVNGKMREGDAKDIVTLRCLGEKTVNGKMREGDAKEKHVEAGLAGGASKTGKMREGDVKEKHVEAGLVGGACKKGKMREGDVKEKHVAAGVARGASKRGKMEHGEKLNAHLKAKHDGKVAARLKMLHDLSITMGGTWRVVAARQNNGKALTRDETAKVGDKLKTSYSWCFANGAVTLTLKRVKQILSS